MTRIRRSPDPAVIDRLDFELRLMPGVVAVGTVERRLSIAATSGEAADRAADLARARLGDDLEIETVTPAVHDAVPSEIVAAILEVVGVRGCSVRGAGEDGSIAIEVIVDSVRAADVVDQLVADALGERFARERMRVVLEIPLTTTA